MDDETRGLHRAYLNSRRARQRLFFAFRIQRPNLVLERRPPIINDFEGPCLPDVA